MMPLLHALNYIYQLFYDIHFAHILASLLKRFSVFLCLKNIKKLIEKKKEIRWRTQYINLRNGFWSEPILALNRANNNLLPAKIYDTNICVDDF